MIRYLIVFNRESSDVVEIHHFQDARIALEARLEAESRYSDRPEIEIVVLNAKSQEALRGTHRRYFEKFSRMAAQALNQWDVSTAG
jgi:hypothetical protein